jgi:hypothetical protein
MSPLIMNAGWGTVTMHSPNPSAAPVETVNLINPTIRHRYVRDPTDLDPVRSEHRETYELGLRRAALRVRGGDDHE